MFVPLDSREGIAVSKEKEEKAEGDSDKQWNQDAYLLAVNHRLGHTCLLAWETHCNQR